MRIVSLNNNAHLLSLRYSWNHIIKYISENIDTDIILVDFMDKYFNLWFDFNKNIKCEGKLYSFKNSDSYYDPKDPYMNDIFIYYDELNFYHMIKWYPEYNEFKTLRGVLIEDLIKKYDINPILSPWIGIIHYPKFTDEMNYHSFEDFSNIVKSDNFKLSIKHCKYLITLSDHCKQYINEILNEQKIPIKVIYHPTDFNCNSFSIQKFKLNNNKKLIQIGFWMRKPNTIYKINTTYKKCWLPGGKHWKDYFIQSYDNWNEYLNDKSVEIILNLSNKDYDKLLERNIVLVDIFNSSANNTVLECIVRNTPIIIKKHPAIIEYLGKDYPLYFETLEDIENILASNTFEEKIKSTFEYLKCMNKKPYTLQYFLDSINEIVKNINIT